MCKGINSECCYGNTPIASVRNSSGNLAIHIETMLKGSKLDPTPESTFTTRRVTVSVNGVNPPRLMTTTNQLMVNYELVVAQATGGASPSTTTAPPSR